MSDIESKMKQVVAGLMTATTDSAKFDKGNDAAGRRVRKACMEATRACKAIRAEVQEIRNSR